MSVIRAKNNDIRIPNPFIHKKSAYIDISPSNISEKAFAEWKIVVFLLSEICGIYNSKQIPCKNHTVKQPLV